MKKLLLTTGAVLLAMATTLSAATLSIVGGTAGTVPGAGGPGPKNDVVKANGLASLGGFYGSKITLDVGATVRVSYIGFEAAFENKFSMGGGSILTDGDSKDTDGTTTIGTADPGNTNKETPAGWGEIFGYDVVVGAGGDLVFSFATSGGGGVPAGSVANGSNPDDALGAAGMNFFATFGTDKMRAGEDLFLFFDDEGAGDDDNHDDLVIRLSVAKEPGGPVIPLPASAFLMLGALGGLGALRARRKS